MANNESIKKRVRFDFIRDVVYVPCREQYIYIKTLLWYSRRDFEQFKQIILHEQNILHNKSKKNNELEIELCIIT